MSKKFYKIGDSEGVVGLIKEADDIILTVGNKAKGTTATQKIERVSTSDYSLPVVEIRESEYNKALKETWSKKKVKKAEKETSSDK